MLAVKTIPLLAVLDLPHHWGSDNTMLLFSIVNLSLKPVVSLRRGTSGEICLFSSKQRNILFFLTGSEFMVLSSIPASAKSADGG